MKLYNFRKRKINIAHHRTPNSIYIVAYIFIYRPWHDSLIAHSCTMHVQIKKNKAWVGDKKSALRGGLISPAQNSK